MGDGSNQPIYNMNELPLTSEPRPMKKGEHNRVTIPYDNDDNGMVIATDKSVSIKLLNMYASAFNRGIDCTLSAKKIKQLLKQKKCAFTGVLFTTSGDNSRTIDRIHSDRGYHDDNVVACTLRINKLKDCISVKELVSMAKVLEKYQ